MTNTDKTQHVGNHIGIYMANEITQEELRSFREQEVVIVDPRKLYINIIGKDQIGNTIVRYNEEIIAYVTTSGVRINNIIQKLRAQHTTTTAIGIAGECEHVGMIGLKSCNCSLQYIHQPLIEQRNASGKRGNIHRLAMDQRHKIEMSGISGHTQRLQSLSAVAFRHSIGFMRR